MDINNVTLNWQCVYDETYKILHPDTCYLRMKTEPESRCFGCSGPKWIGLGEKPELDLPIYTEEEIKEKTESKRKKISVKKPKIVKEHEKDVIDKKIEVLKTKTIKHSVNLLQNVSEELYSVESKSKNNNHTNKSFRINGKNT